MIYDIGQVFHTKCCGHGRVLEVVSKSERFVMTRLHGVGSTVTVEQLQRQDLGPYRASCTWCSSRE